MSESTVTFTYTAPSSYKKYAENIKQTITHDLLRAPALEYSYSVDKQQHQHFFGFAEIDESSLDQFMLAMESYCLKDRLLSCWIENTDTTQYYGLIDGKPQLFFSLDDYKEAKEQSLNRDGVKASTDINFSRLDRVCTLLVRLKVSAKKRKKQILDLFELLQDTSDDKQIAQFDEAVSALKNTKGKQLIVSEEGTIAGTLLNGRVYQGPQHLAKAYIFIFEEGNYLYLGFDMSKLGWKPHDHIYHDSMSEAEDRAIMNKRRMLENLVDVLGPLCFPSDKCWAKYQVNSREELFIFEYDGANSTGREITADDDWNMPR